MTKQQFIKKHGVEVLFLITRYSSIIMITIGWMVLRGFIFLFTGKGIPLICWIIINCFWVLLVLIFFSIYEGLIKDVIRTFTGIEDGR